MAWGRGATLCLCKIWQSDRLTLLTNNSSYNNQTFVTSHCEEKDEMRIFELLNLGHWKILSQSVHTRIFSKFWASAMIVFLSRLSNGCMRVMGMQMNFKSSGHERKAEKMAEWALASLFTWRMIMFFPIWTFWKQNIRHNAQMLRLD